MGVEVVLVVGDAEATGAVVDVVVVVVVVVVGLSAPVSVVDIPLCEGGLTGTPGDAESRWSCMGWAVEGALWDISRDLSD